MKLSFLETEMLRLHLACNTLHLHSRTVIFDSSTTELKIVDKLGWPLCQFFYASNPSLTWYFANISQVKKKLGTQSKTIFPFPGSQAVVFY